MKILVTGSSGFIGYHLVRKLLDSEHSVIGIDNHNDYYDVSLKEHRNNKNKSKKFVFYLQDINEIKVNESKIDLVIHLAAQAGVRLEKSKEYLYQHSNVKGFDAVLRFCKEKNIKKVIYASSSSVYSDEGEGRFTEDTTKLKPKSKYGKSKLLNELHASDFFHKTNFSMIGLRFFSVYGPYGRPDMAYYSFTEALKNKEKISLHNNGDMARDMTYIDDIIHGIMETISYIFSKEICNNEIFNLGNNYPVKTKHMLEFIETQLSLKADINHIETNNESLFTHANIGKAKKILNYTPKTKFEDGMKKFLLWHELRK